jgi:hypothetical protein
MSAKPHSERSPRAPVLFSATLRVGGTDIEIRLRNISEHGAMIEIEHPLGQGNQVLFRRKSTQIEARVAWVKGRYAGICFEGALEPKDLMRSVKASAAPPAIDPSPIYRRPGVRNHNLSPCEKRWAAALKDVIGRS